MKKLNQYKYIQAKNYSNGRNGKEPTVIVLHYTAGKGNAETTAKFFEKGNVKASAHFCVGRDGKVIQCVELDDTAWHAGKSAFRDFDGSVNRISFGIEIANLGWNCESLKDSEVYTGRHRNPASQKTRWELYTEEQYKAVYQLCSELKEEYPSLKYVTFHEDIRNPYVVNIKGAKTDPGPAWDWDALNWNDLGLEQWNFNFQSKNWEMYKK